MDTHCVDGAVWDAEGGIDIVPDARCVTGPVDDGCGVGARQRPSDTSRGFWPLWILHHRNQILQIRRSLDRGVYVC